LKYVKSHPDKIIIATGDTAQLEAIEGISNVKNYDQYIDECINTVFPFEIFLKENKRLKTYEDKQTLKNFKADIFNEDIPVTQTIDKYFKLTDKIETEHNVAYTNRMCKYVSKSVRASMGKASEYEVGEYLICKKYIKTAKYICNNNFEYLINDVSESAITLHDPATKESFALAMHLIRSHFIHAYCLTCHSLQGSSIDNTITIFDLSLTINTYQGSGYIQVSRGLQN
jgi:hypothetical protein